MLWLDWRGIAVNYCRVKHQNPVRRERFLFSTTWAEEMDSLLQKCPADVVDKASQAARSWMRIWMNQSLSDRSCAIILIVCLAGCEKNCFFVYKRVILCSLCHIFLQTLIKSRFAPYRDCIFGNEHFTMFNFFVNIS